MCLANIYVTVQNFLATARICRLGFNGAWLAGLGARTVLDWLVKEGNPLDIVQSNNITKSANPIKPTCLIKDLLFVLLHPVMNIPRTGIAKKIQLSHNRVFFFSFKGFSCLYSFHVFSFSSCYVFCFWRLFFFRL